MAYRKDGSGSSNWDKFLDGTKTSISASINFTTPGSQNRFYALTTTAGNSVNAALADLIICENAALSDDDIAALASGVSARRYAQDADYLFEFNHGTGDEIGLDGSVLTESGTVTNEESPMLSVAAPMLVNFNAGGGAPAATPKFLTLLGVG